jgi:hypothetical protein
MLPQLPKSREVLPRNTLKGSTIPKETWKFITLVCCYLSTSCTILKNSWMRSREHLKSWTKATTKCSNGDNLSTPPTSPPFTWESSLSDGLLSITLIRKSRKSRKRLLGLKKQMIITWKMMTKIRRKTREEIMMIGTLDSENHYNDSFKINNI